MSFDPRLHASQPRSLAVAIVFALSLAATLPASAAPRRPALAYWAFNCFTSCGDANFQPEAVSLATASMTSSFEPDAGTNESGTPLNSIAPFEARSALTLRTGAGGVNNGRDLTWRVNAMGYSSLEVSFAVRRSAGGFASNQLQYSLDGTSWTSFEAPFTPGPDFAVVTFDLRRVRALANNPNAAFRIVFSGGSTSSDTEFVAIDNLQVVGK